MIFFDIIIANILAIIFFTIIKIEINTISLKNIMPPTSVKQLLIYCSHYTTKNIICQQKLYDKNRHIATLTRIPTTSAIKAAAKTNLVFFIPTELV